MPALPDPEKNDTDGKIDSCIFCQHCSADHDTGKSHAGCGVDPLMERTDGKHQCCAPEKQQWRVGGHDEAAKADGGKQHPQHRAPAPGGIPI